MSKHPRRRRRKKRQPETTTTANTAPVTLTINGGGYPPTSLSVVRDRFKLLKARQANG